MWRSGHGRGSRSFLRPSHQSPDGRSWVDRIAAGGVEGFAMAGENVGFTSQAPPNVVAAGGHSGLLAWNQISPGFCLSTRARLLHLVEHVREGGFEL